MIVFPQCPKFVVRKYRERERVTGTAQYSRRCDVRLGRWSARIGCGEGPRGGGGEGIYLSLWSLSTGPPGRGRLRALGPNQPTAEEKRRFSRLKPQRTALRSIYLQSILHLQNIIIKLSPISFSRE